MCHKLMRQRALAPRGSAIRARTSALQWRNPSPPRSGLAHGIKLATRAIVEMEGQAMSPEEVRLVREGWRSIVPIRDTFAELFFGKVFELDPSLRALFRNDLKEQGRNFVAMMSIALRHL